VQSGTIRQDGDVLHPLTRVGLLAAALAATGACGSASTPGADNGGVPAQTGTTAAQPCDLVDPVDLTGTTGVGGWQVSAVDDADRRVCSLSSGEGAQVVVVVTGSSGPRAALPAGLCAPPGSTPVRLPEALDGVRCAYTGPQPGAVTYAGGRGATAVGVRLIGFAGGDRGSPAQLAGTLLDHALSHLPP
jgi:hypothetical protein